VEFVGKYFDLCRRILLAQGLGGGHAGHARPNNHVFHGVEPQLLTVVSLWFTYCHER
jgi:hypothetical protein